MNGVIVANPSTNNKAMSIIKNLREKSGYTQSNLAEKTGLSLRTIQRLEAGDSIPKGHTLKALSNVFEVEPSLLQQRFVGVEQDEQSDKTSIKLINLSILGFFVFPFGNVIFPFMVWRKRGPSRVVDEVGRKIINFQLLWTIVLCFLLCISPFIDPEIFPSFPLILMVLFTALAFNLFIVFYTANSIQRDDTDFLNLPFRLI